VNVLLAAAVHDVKNGLHTLCTQLTQAEIQAPSPALVEARLLATRLDAQLVELLALYRASQGQLAISIADRNVGEFVEDLQREPLLTAGTRSAAMRIEFDHAGALSAGTRAFDAYLVRLVLLDALRNAIRHARSVVRLTVAVPNDGGVEFRVADDGPGFPQGVLDGEDTTMQEDGSGLGLLFARLIARLHATPDGRHGSLRLENNNGARLTLTLP
jgi:signal transduction histidine kinase